METITRLAREITSLKHDIRAEVVINDLITTKYIDENQFIISREGQFSRAYRYDILNTGITDFDLDDTQYLKLEVSRDSIYDTLPQNMVHNVNHETPGKEVDSMISEYQEQKNRQKEARTFFQPFENEIFSYGVSVEKFERDFLTNLNSTEISDIFYNLWGINKDFPPVIISKFIRILPYAYKIVGNIELSCEILSLLLDEKVTAVRKTYHQYSDEKESITLGSSRLGLDFITGNSYDDYSTHYTIKIGPLKNVRFSDFIHDGIMKRFTDLFYEYFFPIEVELETAILLDEKMEHFEFKESESSILGYNTRI